MKRHIALVVAAASLASTASADTDDSRRFGVGIEFGVVGTPTGHLGIPIQGTEDGAHMAAAFDFRWQVGSFWALDVGLGLAHAAIGPAVWVGGELFAPIASARRDLLIIEVYAIPGLQLGFAGPDYFARQDNAFVGYGYAFAGPASFGLRVPAGIRLRWPRARLDTYVEAVPIVTALPSVEQFFEVAVGVRVRF